MREHRTARRLGAVGAATALALALGPTVVTASAAGADPSRHGHHPSPTSSPTTTAGPTTTATPTSATPTSSPTTTTRPRPSSPAPGSTAPTSTAPRPPAPSLRPSAATADLPAAARYLATTTGADGVPGGTSLAVDGYYESFTGFADFGLTLDGALALAATKTDDAALGRVVGFLDDGGRDGSGRTVDAWTGIGTPYAGGGSLGKEALVAEVVGADPRAFGGHDLITALDATGCAAVDPATGCAAAGSYAYAGSTLDQALAILAQLRAGDEATATAPIAYLEGLQHTDGAFGSLIPDQGGDDVDSTAVAAMALALVADDTAASSAETATAAAAEARAVAELASSQLAGGGWSGTAGLSTNSAGLAIQALTLGGTTYATQIAAARTFLAGQQNPDGGFRVSADPGGQQGSDVRASTQVVGGLVGTSFGTLSDTVTATPPVAGPTPSTSPSASPSASAGTTRAATSSQAPTAPSTTGTADPTLPFTGFDALGIGATGAALLVAGAALVATGRRRSSGRHR